MNPRTKFPISLDTRVCPKFLLILFQLERQIVPGRHEEKDDGDNDDDDDDGEEEEEDTDNVP
jgi:hypothetical protein